MKSILTNLLLVVAIALLGFLGFLYMRDRGVPVSQLSVESDERERTVEGLFSLLNEVDSIRLDTGIFDSPQYNSLTDLTVVIPSQPVKRPNPFAPLSRSSSGRR